MRLMNTHAQTRRFKVFGAEVSIRVVGDDSFIHIRSDAWLAVPVVMDLTLSGAFDVPQLSTPGPGPLPEEPEEPEEPTYVDCHPLLPPPLDLSLYFRTSEDEPVSVGVEYPADHPGIAVLNSTSEPLPMWGDAEWPPETVDNGSGVLVPVNRKWQHDYGPWAWQVTSTRTDTVVATDEDGRIQVDVHFSHVLIQKAQALRAAATVRHALGDGGFGVCTQGNDALLDQYQNALIDYPKKITEWLEEIDSRYGASCPAHESTKSAARSASRAVQLAKLDASMRRGMTEAFVRASTQNGMAYVPQRQLPEGEYIVRTASSTVGEPSWLAWSGTADYRAGEEEFAGSWEALVSDTVTPAIPAGSRMGMRITLNNMWADDLPALIEGTRAEMFRVSGEFQHGQLLNGVMEFHTHMGEFYPAYEAPADITATTPDSYREYLQAATAEGSREIDDDRHLKNKAVVRIELLEVEVLDPYTAAWVWTSAPAIVATDPINSYDALECIGRISPINTASFSIRGVRWTGTSTSKYSVVEGQGSWGAAVFTAADSEEPVAAQVDWRLTPDQLRLLPTALAVFQGLNAGAAPLDKTSDSAWTAQTAKRLSPPEEAPGPEDAAKWLAAQGLIWAGYLPTPQE